MLSEWQVEIVGEMCQSDTPILVGGCHPRPAASWMVVNTVCLVVTRYQSADSTMAYDISEKLGALIRISVMCPKCC